MKKIIFSILVCLVLLPIGPVFAAEGLIYGYNKNIELGDGENAFYGVITDTSNANSSLIKLQSPQGTDRFSVSRDGQIRGYEICDEDGTECHDLSDGWAAVGGSGAWSTSGSDVYRSSGEVGIGTDSPDSRLDIEGVGSTQGLRITESTDTRNYILLFEDGTNGGVLAFTSNGGTRYRGTLQANNFLFQTYNGSWLDRMTIEAGGDVGIGTTNPVAPLTVDGDDAGDGDMRYIVQIRNNTDDYNTSPRAGIHFVTKYSSTGAMAGFGGIMVGKENATDANLDSYLSLITRSNSGGNTTKLRITSSGNVGIGITPDASTYKLQMGGPIHMNSNNINVVNQLHFADNLRFVDEGNDNYLRFRYGDTGAGGIKIYDGNDQRQGSLYASGDGENFGLLDADGSWAVRINRDDYVMFNVNNVEQMRIGVNTITIPTDATDLINFTANSTNDSRGISFNSRTALSADYNDTWLRLNQSSEFAAGTYSPGIIRSDGGFYSSGGGGSPYASLKSNTASGYGAWSVGATRGGYSGFNYNNRTTLMMSDATIGLYNDYEDEWLHYCSRNGGCYSYYNNQLRISTAQNYVNISTPYGYIQLGPQNTSWAHIQTDRARFYFNTGLTVDGGAIGSYNENLSLQTSGTTRITVNNSTGNVGIGTTNPGSYKLYVGDGDNVQEAGENVRIEGSLVLGNTANAPRISGCDGCRFTRGVQIEDNLETMGRIHSRQGVVVYAGGTSVAGTSYFSDNLGIGTTNATQRLTVSANDWVDGSIRSQIEVINDTDAYNITPRAGIKFTVKYNSSGSLAGMGGIWVGKENGTSGNLASFMSLGTRSASGGPYERVRITSEGRVGIRTTNPGSYELYVNGDAYASSGWVGSDIRWKKNIANLEKSLDKVNKLRGVTYDWRIEEYPERNFNKETQIGLIAQEVEEVIPELVKTNEDGYKAVSYEKLTVVLLEAIKELEQRVEELENQ